MGLKPRHRRQIRDLLRVLYDDRAWTPAHTDQMLTVIREGRSDVGKEIDKRSGEEFAAQGRELLAMKRQRVSEAREVDQLREILKDQHAKVAMLLEALVDLPMAKALIKDPETGEVTYDPTLISDRDAKVALSAVDKILRVTGAMQPPKQVITFEGGSVFDTLDAVEVEAVDAE